MNDLMRMEYEGRPVRIHLDDEGLPWWVAKDVCDVIELTWKGSDKTGPLGSLESDEKARQTIQTPGGPQEMITVNESGLYTLIIRSNKPEAKRFRRWITHEVLPSIRKTGGYRMPGVKPPIDDVIEAERRTRAAANIILKRLKIYKGLGVPERKARAYAVDLAYVATGEDYRPCLPNGYADLVSAGVRAFVKERCILRDGMITPAQALHMAYLTWAQEERVILVGRNNFYREVMATEANVRRGRFKFGGRRSLGFLGIGLVGDVEDREVSPE